MQDRYAESLNFTPGQSHSLYLQVLAGTGVIGFIAVAMFIWRALRTGAAAGAALIILVLFRGLTEATIHPVVSGLETWILFVILGVSIGGNFIAAVENGHRGLSQRPLDSSLKVFKY
jgi:hypothetical protein